MSTFHDQVHHFHSVLSRSFDAYKDHALNYSSSKFSSLRTALHLRSHPSVPWDRLSPLCKACRAMFEGCRLCNLDYKYFLPGMPDFKDLGHHHHTFAEFEESYRAGCQLCAVLWAANSTITHEFRELRYLISGGEWLKGNMVYFLIVILPDASYSTFMIVRTDHVTRLNYSHVDTYNASTSTWQLEKLWYDHCISNHSKCNLPRPGPEWNPHRLVKVSRVESTAFSQLCEFPDSAHGAVPYAALSYCWGLKPKFRLLLSNHKSLKEKIPIKELPKTFQDAIEIVRKLGIEYLWIDSLCIIQDSPEDWRRESSLMRDLFENCLCCIAATGSKSDEQGFLFERDPLRYNP